MNLRAFASSLYVALFVCASAQAATVAVNNDSSVIRYEQCPSGSLKVTLNAGDRSSKADLLKSIRIFASYPDLRFTPLHENETEVAFLVRVPANCGDGQCARAAGFTELQWRLLHLEGVRITCQSGTGESQSGDNSEGQQEEPKQDEPKRDEGGVTGTN